MKPLFAILMFGMVCLAVIPLSAETSDLFAQPVVVGSKAFKKVLGRVLVTEEQRRDFTQEKHMANRAFPLTSSGTMVVGAGAMCMRTTSPVTMTLKISEEGIWQKNGDDTDFTPAKKNARSRFTVNMLTTLFSGDAAAYDDMFELFLARGRFGWQIGLKPRSKRAARYIEKIVLSGDKELQRISVFLKGGDVNEIYLREESEPSSLTLSNCVS